MCVRVLVILLFSLTLIACDQHEAAAQHEERPITLSADAPPQGLPTLAPMLANVSPAVVNISVQGTEKVAQNPLFQDPLFRQFFNIPQGPSTEHFQAVGSGVIIDAERGYVVTNNHVVRNAEEIQVTLKDRRQFNAKLVGADPQTDIAVLKIQADSLTALPLGISKDIKVGDYVVAIGDPFGLGQTATFGIVSALGRTGLGIEGYEDFIQTDASINPGNSGGALVNMAGQLIGMNTAILSQSGGNVGVGFAIPVDMVRTIAQELIASGKVSRGELGVRVQNLTPVLAQAMGINISSGALVSKVVPDSPAAKAGIKSGDVITKLDENAVTSSSDLRNGVGEKAPGTDVRLTLLRDGKEQTVTATLEPMKTASASEATGTQRKNAFLSGLTIGPIPQNDPNYGKVKGVYVESVDPSSASALAGLQQGDIITSVGQTPVGTTGQFNRIVREQTKGKPLLLEVQRGNSSLFIAIA
ncbi:MAG TPA: DegQ family serine endoprotease [Methylocella sp.]|nr:DegQ family serine endoprotease [Methylocella sp.]